VKVFEEIAPEKAIKYTASLIMHPVPAWPAV
jgi:hypothetical protein